MLRPRLFLLALVLAGLTAPVQSAEPFRYPEGKHGKGELRFLNGFAVLTVEGTPEEIGEQVAVLAGKPAERLLSFPRELLARMVTAPGAKALWPILSKQGNALVPNFPPDHRRELEAFIKTAGIDREAIVAANTVFDLKYLVMPLIHCSALVVESDRSRTSQPIFGRNMDYNALGYLHAYGLITVYRQKGKHTFAAIGWPGTVGVVSGINDKGLAVAALETTGAPREEGPAFDPQGTPFALCYRRILEECSTVAEAEKLLRSMKRTTTQNLTVCDRNGGAVFEFTPSRVAVRRPEKSICTCTNHFLAKELKLAEPKNIATTLDRYEAICKARAEEQKLGVAEVQRYLDTVNQGLETIQTMVFEPAALTVHLSFSDGKKPSSSLPLKRLDLAPLLKRD